jgi:hypothetical protein
MGTVRPIPFTAAAVDFPDHPAGDSIVPLAVGNRANEDAVNGLSDDDSDGDDERPHVPADSHGEGAVTILPIERRAYQHADDLEIEDDQERGLSWSDQDEEDDDDDGAGEKCDTTTSWITGVASKAPAKARAVPMEQVDEETKPTAVAALQNAWL